MIVTIKTFCIVCPLLFLAGLIDSIGGGGGLISLPAFLIAGLPSHMAIGTNKLSASMGTSVAALRLGKNGYINLRLAVPGIIAAFLGSTTGSRLSLLVSDEILKTVMVVILPFCAFVVLNKKSFRDNNPEDFAVTKKNILIISLASFVIGIYDGFYGPGTGTFLLIVFNVLVHMDIRSANGLAKMINFATGIGSLAVFLLNGKVLFLLGIVAGLCNMLGNYIGSGLMIKNGSRIVRPAIIFVFLLLLARILFLKE